MFKGWTLLRCSVQLAAAAKVAGDIRLHQVAVETTFIDIVRAGDPIPANLAQCIHNHYFKYHRLRSIPRVLGPLCVIQNFESVTSWRSKISEAAARNLASYFSAPHWYLPLRGSIADERVSWIELVLDFVSTYGFQPGWIHSEMSLGQLARRFQVFSKRLLTSHNINIRAISSLHLSEFGFRRLASIYMHKKLVFPDKVLAFLLQLVCSNPSDSLDLTQKKHIALYWKPSFNILTRPVVIRSTVNGPWNRLKDFVLQVWLAVSSQNLSRAEQRRLKKIRWLLFRGGLAKVVHGSTTLRTPAWLTSTSRGSAKRKKEECLAPKGPLAQIQIPASLTIETWLCSKLPGVRSPATNTARKVQSESAQSCEFLKPSFILQLCITLCKRILSVRASWLPLALGQTYCAHSES